MLSTVHPYNNKTNIFLPNGQLETIAANHSFTNTWFVNIWQLKHRNHT